MKRVIFFGLMVLCGAAMAFAQEPAARGGRGQAQAADPVFRSRKGGGALDVSQVRRIVYAAARNAGLEQKVSPHWMRHAHASHALDRSAPIHLVQATLGQGAAPLRGLPHEAVHLQSRSQLLAAHHRLSLAGAHGQTEVLTHPGPVSSQRVRPE